MSESVHPINPYLATLIHKLKAQVSEEQLSEEYRQSGSKLSFLEFLGEKALRGAIKENPVLRMRRASFDLPEEILDGLYWLRVDVLADLLQLTVEELKRFEKQENLDVDVIEGFLLRNGLALCHGVTEDSWKIPALRIIDPLRAGLWEQWDLASLEGHKMHPARPALVQDWFNEYYRRNEYIAGEENLADRWLGIKPELEKGAIPSDLAVFFNDVKEYFASYENLCVELHLPMVVDIPKVPERPEDLACFANDRYLSIKKDVIRALIFVLENTTLLGMPTYKFLRASDEKKLNIVETITGSQYFQLLLIEYVAVRVDFEDVFDYFSKQGARLGMPKEADRGREPINPWLGELILKYRKTHSDAAIREDYRRFSEKTPDKSWGDFLAERALLEESQRNPFILKEIGDSSLPEGTKEYLSYNCAVDIMADLLQLTAEELKALFEERPGEIPVIEKFLEEQGLHLYHCDRYTYKLPFPEE